MKYSSLILKKAIFPPYYIYRGEQIAFLVIVFSQIYLILSAALTSASSASIALRAMT